MQLNYDQYDKRYKNLKILSIFIQDVKIYIEKCSKISEIYVYGIFKLVPYTYIIAVLYYTCENVKKFFHNYIHHRLEE